MTLRRIAALVVVVVTLIAPIALAPVAARADDPATSDTLLSAVAEAYAMRVEYDLPVPAGTGSVGHVTATAQRSAAVETSHGLAAAPSELDAVVGGKYADPQGSGHPIDKLPQVECHHPSDNPTNIFRFPTDTNSNTAGVPASSYAYATCGAGPSVDVRARVGDTAAPTAADGDGSAAISSMASIHPDHGKLGAKAMSSATALSFAGGAIRIGSVAAAGQSITAGTPGSASSAADVLLSDVNVAGLVFSLAFTGSGVNVITGGASVPIDDATGQAVIDAANAAVKPSGCTLTVGRDPSAYPQGFLFSRPQPDLGVRDDGSLAASYRGGLLIVCDIPDNPVSKGTQFSPERFQALVGFVYTSVAAGASVGGFGIGDLGGSGALQPTLDGIALPSGLSSPGLAFPPQQTSAVDNAATAAPARGSDHGDVTTVLTSFLKPLPPGARWALALASIVLWVWLTHLGLTRLLSVGPAEEDLA